MEIKAVTKYLRQSPRKVRLSAGLVRGLKTTTALDQLRFNNKASSLPVAKLIKSAVANAINNFDLKEDNLYIKEIRVDEGPTLKRWMPRAHGRATPLNKRSSHISLVLSEIKDSGIKAGKKQELSAPMKLGEKPKQEEEKVEKKEKGELKKLKEKKNISPEPTAEIIDARGEGKGKHTKIEGSSTKGFSKKIFRRKSG